MSLPLVTVGIAVYNGERFLGEALESVLHQSYQHLEIILYNDGSADASLDIARSYGDSRVVILDSHLNRGVSHARQTIKGRARGQYLVWLDADDRYLPCRIEQLVENALKSDADIICDEYSVIAEDGTPTGRKLKIPDYLAADPSFTRLFERNRMLPHPMLSRRCYSSIDYDRKLATSEDYDYWLQCTRAGYRYAKVDSTGLEYRIVEGSLSSDHVRSRYYTKVIFSKYSVNELLKLYLERGLPETVGNYMACLQYIFRGNFAKAYDYALLPWSDDGMADRLFYLGTIALLLKRYEQAAGALLAHLEAFPESPAGLNNLGVLYRQQGLEEKAMECFTQAKRKFDTYQDASENVNNNHSGVITLTQLSSGRPR